jgi:hypothetical protein
LSAPNVSSASYSSAVMPSTAAGPLGDLHRSIEQGSLPNSGIPGDQKHRRIEFSRACCEGGERFQFGIPPEEHAYQPITVSARSPSTRT